MKNSITIIVAYTNNLLIGKDNSIPWHISDDLKRFKKLTTGNVIIMGRKTFESIGRPLPGRQTIILSRQQFSAQGTTCIHSLEDIESASKNPLIWIAGGSEIYKLLLPKCSDLYLTRVHLNPKGDTFFPEFETQFELKEILKKETDFSIEHWRQKS